MAVSVMKLRHRVAEGLNLAVWPLLCLSIIMILPSNMHHSCPWHRRLSATRNDFMEQATGADRVFSQWKKNKDGTAWCRPPSDMNLALNVKMKSLSRNRARNLKQ
ncbi:hypothetical protein F5J12DRAFT_791681 [Pisolithus orientalis]|uniref:uncharacterized protein n=1 Tax=Pisolithus orientalis TaxID=936130 RepID=UPI0022240242|nr:uncharacterized protein F5J12DRAFT_791681 [Pisolithus orientalis]KAI6035196.1 hypothetical protein F5J12DRAFT_791681 [Pisolithus orientalis]